MTTTYPGTNLDLSLPRSPREPAKTLDLPRTRRRGLSAAPRPEGG
jgi:hypothetical protein